jgi:hypothetical protein
MKQQEKNKRNKEKINIPWGASDGKVWGVLGQNSGMLYLTCWHRERT